MSKTPPDSTTAQAGVSGAAAPSAGLKLIALDEEDLLVLAAHLQDAVTVVGDMVFQPREKRLVVLLNRFDWTAEVDRKMPGVRRRAALRIEQVQRAQLQGIDLKSKGEVVSILSLLFEPAAEAARAPAGYLTLVCAGGAAIRLDVDCIETQLEDLGPAWAAKAKPKHDE